jgi:hypothetical protein
VREILVLPLLALAVLVFQTALLPRVVPAALQPDVGLWLAMPGLAYLRRPAALIFLFVLGLQGDLFGSERFGLLLLGYLLAAAALGGFEQELARGGWRAAWVGTIVGTALAHGSYWLLSRLLGAGTLSEGLMALGVRVALAAAFGGAAAWLLREIFAAADLLAPLPKLVRERSQPARAVFIPARAKL